MLGGTQKIKVSATAVPFYEKNLTSKKSVVILIEFDFKKLKLIID